MQPSDVVPVEDLEPAAWLLGEVGTPGPRVGDLLPGGYAAHVRVPGDRVGDQVIRLLRTRDVLARHTTTPATCWFGWWVGFALPSAWQRAPQLHLPWRDHLVFAGGLDELEVISAAFGEVGYVEPSLWWPADRAWVAHWEVDCDATYVAGSQAMADDLVAAGIDAHPVSADDAVTLVG